MNVVITGANRGIGLEFVRQYLARGDTVRAGVRTPGSSYELEALAGPNNGRLQINYLDVTLESSVRAFAATVTEPVDLLINNAGVRTPNKADAFQTFNVQEALKSFQVNALGALAVVRALLPMLRCLKSAKIANVSSGLGCIDGNTTGGAYGYRMSKAALNMASRSMAHDLREEGIIVVALSPGWVRTDMGGSDAPTSAADAAAGLMVVIDQLTIWETGGFYGVRGERIAW